MSQIETNHTSVPAAAASPLEPFMGKPINHVGFGDNGVFRVETMEGLERLAKVYIWGGYADALVRGTTSDKQAIARVMIALSYGRQLGLSDIQALNCIAVINGKPCLYGDGQLAIVLARGHLESIEETFEGDGASRVAVCRVKRRGLEVHERRFGAKDKERAGINNPTYGKYPDRMYQLRARAFALRDRFADDLMGISIKEEIEDQVEAEQVEATSTLIERIDKAAERAPEAGSEPAPEPPPTSETMTQDQAAFVESVGDIFGQKG